MVALSETAAQQGDAQIQALHDQHSDLSMDENVLERELAMKTHELTSGVAYMKDDLKRIADDSYFKRWLMQQKRVLKAQEDMMGLPF